MNRHTFKSGWLLTALLSMAGCASHQPGSDPDPASGLTFVYACDQDYRFVARVEPDNAWLFLPDITVNLAHEPSAAAAGYRGSNYRYRYDGEEAWLEVKREKYHCRNDRAAAVWQAARLDGADFRAVGNEPGWWLTIGSERMVFVGDYGKRRVEMATPEAEVFADQRFTRYTVRQAGAEVDIELRGIDCRDSMSGEDFPVTVRVVFNGVQLHGCGRALH